MRTIPSSELIINDDGTIFHLHLLPSQLSDVVILVGDPARVGAVASRFEEVECRVENREFCTVTGSYHGRRMSVISTGIGCDNIDIVVTELDALVNIDFETRQVKEQTQSLTLVRLGTSGGVQPSIKVGDMILSAISVGFDGLINYYDGCEDVVDIAAEQAFMKHMEWGERLTTPYFVESNAELGHLFAEFTTPGITISAPGFYAPQGRHVRLRPADENMLEKIESFEWEGQRITNFEMESSALASLSALMGHRATTICTIIAQRSKLEVAPDYHAFVDRMICCALEKLSTI